jgi:hypothetical protein
MPAKAGIHDFLCCDEDESWILVCAGAPTEELEAFDTLFNKRDYDAASRFRSGKYVQHSAYVEPGRQRLFNLVRGLPDSLGYEHGWSSRQAIALSPATSRPGGLSRTKDGPNWLLAVSAPRRRP